MKKSNIKSSQQKAKRYAKNKKRVADKPKLSRFERRQARIREEILDNFLTLVK